MEREPTLQFDHLCTYYLECLMQDNGTGIALDLIHDKSHYVELSTFGLDGGDPAVADLVRQGAASRTNTTAYVGYPVLLVKRAASSASPRMTRIPIFLFSVDISQGRCELATQPVINLEAVKPFTDLRSEAPVYDVLRLDEELGLNATQAAVDVAALVRKL